VCYDRALEALLAATDWGTAGDLAARYFGGADVSRQFVKVQADHPIVRLQCQGVDLLG
jgi:hypothetical protein